MNSQYISPIFMLYTTNYALHKIKLDKYFIYAII